MHFAGEIQDVFLRSCIDFDRVEKTAGNLTQFLGFYVKRE
jgi:hypothetical protein